MAILRGPYGTGYVKRLGATVGQKAGNGKYKIYAYQPEVRNPQTLPQRVQRAKFSFLRTLAKQFTNAGLLGLEREPYATLAQAFMSLNMPKVVINGTASVAQVDVYETCPDIVLSNGYEVTPNYNINRLQAGVLTTEIRTPMMGSNAKPDGVIVVVGVDKLIGVAGYEVQIYDYGYTGTSANTWTTGDKTISVLLPGGNPASDSYSAYVWFYNYRYVGGKVRVGENEWAAVPRHDIDSIGISSPADLVGAVRRYSPTAFFSAANLV